MLTGQILADDEFLRSAPLWHGINRLINPLESMSEKSQTSRRGSTACNFKRKTTSAPKSKRLLEKALVVSGSPPSPKRHDRCASG